MLIRKLLVSILVVLPACLFSQSGVWDRWDAELVRSLNTAHEIEYLNDEEKKVILFMNLARNNGPLFAETFLDAYVAENQTEKSSYLRSLYKDLKKVSGLTPLLPEKDLTALAQNQTKKTGESGRVGHSDFKKRFEPVMGNPYNHVGENCSYGYKTAIDIVITLLIDENVKDLGHRHNTLSEGFNSVGVAIRSHKKYRVNCVIDFGRQDRSNLNQVPY